MSNKGGKIPAIPQETRDAMQLMRDGKKTIKEIADFYHVSANSVLKYTHGLGDLPVSSSAELDSDVTDFIADQHANRVLDNSKKLDADTVHAGEALREHFKSRGIDIDLRKIPTDQLIKLVKSPGADNMDANVKDVFNNWLSEKVNKLDPAIEKTGKVSFEDIKEMMLLNFLGKMANQGDSPPQDNSLIAEIKAENERLRQEFRDELEKNRQEMKDLVLEKRLQTMDETHMETVSSLSGQLNDLLDKIESLKTTLPVSPASGVTQKTALDELTDAVSKINGIKGSLTSLGVIPVVPGAPVDYKNPDGSLDFTRYAGDKLESTIKTLADAYSRRAPDRKPVLETPPVSYRLSVDQAEQVYQQLLLKPSLTPVETGWVAEYLPIRAQYHPILESSPSSYPVSSSPAVEPASVPSKDVSEPVAQDTVELGEQISVLDRLRIEEEQSAKSLEGVL